MQIVHHQHAKNRRPWIPLHVVSGPWTSIVAALDKGQFNIAVCRRYIHIHIYIYSESQISTQREREDKRTRSKSYLAQNGPEQVMDVLPDNEDETGSVVVSEYEEAECKEESVNLGASYRQCRADREAKTIQDVAYISYTTEIKKESADVVGSMDTALD
jgi:hypothetical protein